MLDRETPRLVVRKLLGDRLLPSIDRVEDRLRIARAKVRVTLDGVAKLSHVSRPRLASEAPSTSDRIM